MDTDHCETIWIEIESAKHQNVLVGIVYRHPNTDISTFNTEFHKTIIQLNKENKIIYICGDFNIDFMKIKTDHNVSSYYDMLLSAGLVCGIQNPTRLTDHSATLIDHFYTNNIKQNN